MCLPSVGQARMLADEFERLIGQPAVSPSPFRSLSQLAPMLRLVSPAELAPAAADTSQR